MPCAAKTGRRNAMNGYAVHAILPRINGLAGIIMPGAQDADGVPAPGQLSAQVEHHSAGRGDVRWTKLVQKKNVHCMNVPPSRIIASG